MIDGYHRSMLVREHVSNGNMNGNRACVLEMISYNPYPLIVRLHENSYERESMGVEAKTFRFEMKNIIAVKVVLINPQINAED